MCKNMKCKNRSIGCSKFCDRSRGSFQDTLEEVKLQLRVRRKEVRRNEDKQVCGGSW